MEAAKKVEIICDSVEVNNVIEILEGVGITGYPIIRDVIRNGERGTRRSDNLRDIFTNGMIITVCKEPLIPKVVEPI